MFGVSDSHIKCHTPSPVDFRREQDTDLNLQKWIKRHLNTDTPFHPELVNAGETSIWVDAKDKQPRILVPTSLQHSVFDSVHQLAHPTFKAGYKLIKQKYWWSGMSKDISKRSLSCKPCQLAKIHRHVKAPLHHLPPPTNRFSHIHVDLVGPLPQCEGKICFLRSLIDGQAGQRHTLCLQPVMPPLLRLVLSLSSGNGYLGSVFLMLLLRIVAHSSHRHCGCHCV